MVNDVQICHWCRSEMVEGNEFPKLSWEFAPWSSAAINPRTGENILKTKRREKMKPVNNIRNKNKFTCNKSADDFVQFLGI